VVGYLGEEVVNHFGEGKVAFPQVKLIWEAINVAIENIRAKKVSSAVSSCHG
jgi:hypothetical protein